MLGFFSKIILWSTFFLHRLFAVKKFYFDVQRDIIHTSVQLFDKQNTMFYLLVLILVNKYFLYA